MMRRIAIMQPYIFPYVGYFQLIRAVDLFVFYNDVNFIKKGWIHRNKILLNGQEFMFTIPCQEISQNKKICEIKIAWGERESTKLLSTIEQAYKKAPYFEPTFEMITRTFSRRPEFIDELAIESVKEVSAMLGLTTRFEKSAGRYHNDTLTREDRLIDICRIENIQNYINPIGGQAIYSKDMFRVRGIDLQFLKSDFISYPQFNSEFVPWLSILDVLMFTDSKAISNYLDNFVLV